MVTSTSGAAGDSAGDSGVARRPATRLALVFGLIYFVQGIAEPTEGLIAQPTRSLLREFGLGAGEIAGFMLIVGLPWYLKPLFGLMIDSVPLAGSRRRSWLLLALAMTAVGLTLAGLLELPFGATATLLLLLLIPCIGVALADVATDALMVGKGQALGLTGRLQSVQWGALYGAGILTGVVGGFLSERGLQQLGFLICGGFALLGLVVSWRLLEPDRKRITVAGAGPSEHTQAAAAGKASAHADPPTVRSTLSAFRGAFVLPIAAFLFLLNFNPFSADVLYVHLTTALGRSEQFVGLSYSIGSVAAIAACIVYGLFAHRLGARALIHLSLVAMVVCSLAYLLLAGPASVLIIAAAVAFALMLTTLAQLDLAARYCPAASAATVFATLMALSNLSLALASRLGGGWYEDWLTALGAERAFEMLVLIGAGCTAACWLLLPVLPGRSARRQA